METNVNKFQTMSQGLTYFTSHVFVNIGSGNGLSPVWHQAFALTNANLLSIGPH